MSIDDILTGELWKRGKGTSFFGRKSWKKRWFALHQTGPGAGSDEPVAYLEYYHGDSAFGHKPVGRYALNGDCGCERLAGPADASSSVSVPVSCGSVLFGRHCPRSFAHTVTQGDTLCPAFLTAGKVL